MKRSENLPQNKQERITAVLEMPDLEEQIIDHLESGGCLVDLAELYNIPPRVLTDFMQMNGDERKQRFFLAIENRHEYAKAKILREVERIAHSDVRKLYNEDGTMKPVHEWPADIAASVAGLDVSELTDPETGEGVGHIKKMKRESRLQALKMLSVQVDELKPRPVEVNAKMSLEDLVAGSWDESDDEG